jgi:hypothetical protein
MANYNKRTKMTEEIFCGVVSQHIAKGTYRLNYKRILESAEIAAEEYRKLTEKSQESEDS